MKCIRHKETDEVRRLSDIEAAKTIAANSQWHYTTKSVWKDRKTQAEPVEA